MAVQADKALTPASLNAALWSICDIFRRSHCAGALQYVPELTWLLFLRFLDEDEGAPSVLPPWRWRDWAAPDGARRRELIAGPGGTLLHFVYEDLLPNLRAFGQLRGATARQRAIGEILFNCPRTRFGVERDLIEVLDRLDRLGRRAIDERHIFPMSQVYEALLGRLADKAGDGGQFFTPREVVRAMVRTIAPVIGETIYDPCCGTGGFLAQVAEHLRAAGPLSAVDEDMLRHHTFYGREKEPLIYPLALANLLLHGIDEPHIWHGNTLSGSMMRDAFSFPKEERFDVILTNPPFGARESEEVQHAFPVKCSATQVLFLQHVIDRLKPGGRCGIVLDEGVLFRAENGFVRTKQRLLEECDLWCVVSLPPGMFTSVGAAVKTNLLFFIKGRPTERVWYYDLSFLRIGKRTPLTSEHFAEFFSLLPERAQSERSWTVSRQEIIARNYDLKAVNPSSRSAQEGRTREEILARFAEGQIELQSLLSQIRGLG